MLFGYVNSSISSDIICDSFLVTFDIICQTFDNIDNIDVFSLSHILYVTVKSL